MTRQTHTAMAIMAGLIFCHYCEGPKIEIISGVVNAAMLPDLDQKIRILKHRGFTHSFIIPGMLYAAQRIMTGSTKYIIIGLFIGWLSHIAIDLLNGKGGEVLWPISKYNFKLMDLDYNGKGEKVIFAICIISIIILFVGIENIQFIYHNYIKETIKTAILTKN